MRDTFLAFSPPLIGEEEIAEVVDTLRSDWLTTGPKVKRFEEEFAASTGAPAALALNSCTSAMHVALVTLGIGPGDAVITTPMTFCSTVHVIEQAGARPVLVDVEPDTLNIDPARIESALQELWRDEAGRLRVRALMPVHLYGHPCRMDEILDIAARYDLAVIDDAAHALPARYKQRAIGSFAESSATPVLTCFSFYATKNLNTGEGGMLAGSLAQIAEARRWSLHGMNQDAWRRYGAEGSWYYEVDRAGFKYNMTDVQAALGLQQLRRLPDLQARRQRIVERYNAALSGLEELETPTVRPEVEHAWQLYTIRLNLDRCPVSRNRFIEEMKARNIGTSVHFIPVHLHPYYRDKYGYSPASFPVAYHEYRRLVSLPLSPRMTERDADDVIDAVCDIVKARQARAA